MMPIFWELVSPVVGAGCGTSEDASADGVVAVAEAEDELDLVDDARVVVEYWLDDCVLESVDLLEVVVIDSSVVEGAAVWITMVAVIVT